MARAWRSPERRPPPELGPGRRLGDTRSIMDWESFDPSPLFDAIRERGPAPDAEQTVWAFERALQVARADAAFIEHLVVASVSLLALERAETPRTILEQLFRRAVSDREWRERYEQFAT